MVMNELFTVVKVSGGFAVQNWNGEIEIVYKNRKHAEQYSRGATHALVNEAETYGLRLDRVRRYLDERAARPVVEKAQIEMAL